MSVYRKDHRRRNDRNRTDPTTSPETRERKERTENGKGNDSPLTLPKISAQTNLLSKIKKVPPDDNENANS